MNRIFIKSMDRYYPTFDYADMSDGYTVSISDIVISDYPTIPLSEWRALKADNPEISHSGGFYYKKDLHDLWDKGILTAKGKIADHKAKSKLKIRNLYKVTIHKKDLGWNNSIFRGEVRIPAYSLDEAKKRAKEKSKKIGIRIIKVEDIPLKPGVFTIF